MEQCAGFIRIPDGTNPLENTAVHPESYDIAEELLKTLGYGTEDLKDKDKLVELRKKLGSINLTETAKALNVGEMTLKDIIDELFVDIGVKHDGLVHISEMSEKFVKNPSDIVSVGDIVKVKVIGIDNERQKVKLSMKIG